MTLPLLRPATTGDLAALVALEAEVFGAGAWSEESMAAELEGPERRVIVSADHTGELSGYVAVRAAGDVVDVMRIAVRPDHRRRGLGGLLLHAAVDASASFHGVDRMLLEVAASNAAATALYQSHGFAVIDRRAGYYGHGRDALVMQRPVGSPPLER